MRKITSKCCLFFLLASLLTINLKSQTVYKKNSVIDSIIKFNKQNQSGFLVVKRKFKSSIAEDTTIYTSDYFFSVTKTKFNIKNINKKNNSVTYVNNSKTFVTNEKDKSFFEADTKEYLELYSLFILALSIDTLSKELRNNEYKFSTDSAFFYFRNLGIIYQFAKSNYSFKRKKNYIWEGEFGMRYEEYEVIKAEYHNKYANKTIYTISALKGLKKKDYSIRKTNNTSESKLIGCNFSINSFKTVAGDSIDIKKYNGYILVDFFYESCHPCILSFKSIDTLVKRYSDKIKVISFDPIPSDTLNIKRFLKRYKISHDVVVGKFAENVVEKYSDKNVFPTFLLIDKQKKIVKVYYGFEEKNFDEIKQLIN